MTEYMPGLCNIGPEEIKKRRQLGIVGLVISLIFFVLLIALKTNLAWRLLIFFPVFFAATGFLQARMHFCAGYGLRGLYNMSKRVGNTDSVEQSEFRKKDKQKAVQITIWAVLIGLIVIGIIYNLPF
ncbi:MAG TPA: hypothetical protein VNW29_05445 [Candidatus Sulfotelmatobacter sp.]|jgi:hypothetical protein|nr:hypothetical protein [Candidatus Sulfotelmatobacter sp.]